MTVDKKWTMAEIRKVNLETSHFWFSRGAMAFFGTRLHGGPKQGPGGVFFVTSEQPPHGPRAFSVRQFNPSDGSVKTADKTVIASLSRSNANEVAKRLAAGDSQ